MRPKLGPLKAAGHYEPEHREEDPVAAPSAAKEMVDPFSRIYALRGDGLIFTTFDGGLDLSRRNASATLSASCAKR